MAMLQKVQEETALEGEIAVCSVHTPPRLLLWLIHPE